MHQDELSIIDRYFRPLAGEGAFGLCDDAGIIAPPAGCDLVVTTDMIAGGVHFLADDPPATIAQKALRVNISDLAAKGATPLAYVLSLGLSPDLDEAWLTAFAEGLRMDQHRFAIQLLGGDTTVLPERPVISVTAFGSVAKGRMVHRFGGKPGDELYVSGHDRRRRSRARASQGRGGALVEARSGRARGAGGALPRAGAANRAGAGPRRIRLGRHGYFRRAGRRLRQALRGLRLLGLDRGGQGAACAWPRRIRRCGLAGPLSDRRRRL